MAIEKLSEFAKDGQKNTDDLVLTDGFSVSRKPARQWFNYLFNMLSLKINEIIELDPVARSEIADNLTTDDANKVASARTVKELQDKKLEAADLKDASTIQKGIVKLNNTLISDAEDEAATAGTVKLLNDRFTNDFLNTKTETGYQKYPNGRIEQWGIVTASGDKTVIFPIAFTSIVTHASITFYAGTPSNTTMNPMIYKNNLTLTGMKIFAGTAPPEHTMMWKVEGY